MLLVWPKQTKKKQVDISFVDDDDDDENDGKRIDIRAVEGGGKEADEGNNGKESSKVIAGAQANSERPENNLIEAILATMQLLPPIPPPSHSGAGLLQMTTDSERSEQIQRSISVIRSFAQQQLLQELPRTLLPPLPLLSSSSSTSSPLLRRKSKSHFGLNEMCKHSSSKRTPPTVETATKASAKASADLLLGRQRDPDELRSLQRQLQNFPSLEELRRHPLKPLAAKNTKPDVALGANTNRHSLSPATSQHWLIDTIAVQDSPTPSATCKSKTNSHHYHHGHLERSMTTSEADTESDRRRRQEMINDDDDGGICTSTSVVAASPNAVDTATIVVKRRPSQSRQPLIHHQNIESCGMSVLQILKASGQPIGFFLIIRGKKIIMRGVFGVQESMESGVIDTRRTSVCRELDEMFESIKSLVVPRGSCDQLADQIRNKFIQPVSIYYLVSSAQFSYFDY